jgi:hypothetical protein
VTDDAGDLRIDEFLGDRRPELRVRLIVLAHHLELDDLAAELDLLRGRFVDGEVDAVLVVLAQVRDAAGQRSRVADLDGDRFLGGRGRRGGGSGRGGLRRGGLLGFFLAAAVDAKYRSGDERQADRTGRNPLNAMQW